MFFTLVALDSALNMIVAQNRVRNTIMTRVSRVLFKRVFLETTFFCLREF